MTVGIFTVSLPEGAESELCRWDLATAEAMEEGLPAGICGHRGTEPRAELLQGREGAVVCGTNSTRASFSSHSLLSR